LSAKEEKLTALYEEFVEQVVAWRRSEHLLSLELLKKVKMFQFSQYMFSYLVMWRLSI
jgi:hypothetical protein